MLRSELKMANTHDGNMNSEVQSVLRRVRRTLDEVERLIIEQHCYLAARSRLHECKVNLERVEHIIDTGDTCRHIDRLLDVAWGAQFSDT